MLAVDTNVVVRLLVNDDQQQGVAALALFESNEMWIGVTVLLEVAWVLQSVYQQKPAAMARALRGLLGLPNVTVEDPAAVGAALDAAAAGMQFPDAMHVVRAPEDVEFVTFDRALARAGKRLRAVRLA